MPKTATNPPLYDNVLRITMSKFIQWKYIRPGKSVKSNIIWSNRGEKIAEIGIYISLLDEENMFIELDYKYKGEPRKYRIKIVSIISNLKKGLIYYFVCPHTNKQCRNLYFDNGYFWHRRAIRGMYESQIMSKETRELIRDYRLTFEYEKIYQQLYKKNFKKTYSGNPTKRYIKMSKKLERYI